MDDTCSVPSCDRPLKTRGWCQAHYMRWWSTGDVQPDRPLFVYGKPILDRLLERVSKDPDGCWRWQGHTNKGYGYIRARNDQTSLLVHRVAYEEMVGPIPIGQQLDHLCHTNDVTCIGGPTCRHRRCVNPAHLEPVTNLENAGRGRAGDAVRRRVAQITHCPQGHEYTAENTGRNGTTGGRYCKQCNRDRAKIRTYKSRGLSDPRRTVTDQQIAEMFQLKGEGLSHARIAEIVGVSVASVSRFTNGQARSAP